MVSVLIDLMISMRLFEESQHNYYPTEDTLMKSFFISAIAACMTPKPVFYDGDNWDIVYEWTCEDMEHGTKTIQIKAFAEFPTSSTSTIDLFNRFPTSDPDEVISE